MKTAELTKTQAKWIMYLDLGVETQEKLEHYCLPGMPALTHLGSKLCSVGKGKYLLRGYYADGTDVTKILEEAMELKMKHELRSIKVFEF